MDRITLESGKTYDAAFASESLSTGNFVAKLLNTTLFDAVSGFEHPGTITVENPDTGRQIYEGYGGALSAKTFPDGILITVGLDVKE